MNVDGQSLRLSDFDYDLPAARIAQQPCEPRDAAKLLVIHLADQRIEHRQVRELPELLRADDLLILNRTRVIPARLVGRKATGGACEVLLIHPEAAAEAVTWRVLIRGRVRTGSELVVAGQPCQVAACHSEGERSLRFPADCDVQALAEAHGHMPLPPYIKRPDTAADRQRYQTVFGDSPGSVAAPTASLHLTEELLARLDRRGIEHRLVDLAVGPGTFKPVQVDDPSAHQMHAEFCRCEADTAAAINRQRTAGKRVIAVGTTVVRTLESAVDADGRCQPFADWTRIFLHPPARLQLVDGLLTNFHLPRSTLLMLVACLTGVDGLQQIYRTAIAEDYRFYSYGDAMLILP